MAATVSGNMQQTTIGTFGISRPRLLESNCRTSGPTAKTRSGTVCAYFSAR